MGSGLSMASVNKIKELANAREYGLALDILDSQDLTKSLNPQFLRLCGEIYIYNKRYKEARHVLLIAHKLAPEAKRIIYTIMFLYLKMGYKDLAKQYYDIYMFDADENVLETKQVMYIYNKANKASVDDLEKYIAPTYSNTMDYEWTYETILLYLVQGRDKEAEGLIQIYSATFKESEHDITIRDIVDGKADAEALYSSFADADFADDDLEQAADRELEAKLLCADDLRIHPREPEIVIMVDDNDDDEIVPKRKLKKMLKEQERKEKEAKEENKEENADADVNQNITSGDISDDKNTDTGTQEVEDKVTDGGKTEGKMTDNDKTEEVNNLDSADLVETQGDGETAKSRKNFIKNIFSRAKKKDKSEDGEEDTLKEDEEAATTVEQVESDDEKTKEAEKEAYEKARNIFFGDDSEEDKSDKESTNAEDDSESTDGDNDMREIHMKERNSIKKPIVTVDMGDDDFTAESDTIENLHDSEGFGNPFDSIVATKGDEAVPSYKVKKSISFETAELADVEDDDEYEVDDFSSLNEEEDEFGEMRVIEPEPEEVEETLEPEEEFTVAEEELKSEPEPEELEPEAEEEVEPESEVVEPEIEEIEEEPELDIEESEEEPEPEAEIEPEEEFTEVEEEVEPETEVVEPEIEEIEEEPELDIEESEEELEPEAEEEVKPESEVVEPEIEEIEEEPELDIEESEEEPDETLYSTYSEQEIDSMFKVPPKKKLDYPVFKSSLFPDYHNDEPEVENNFSEILQEAQDKIHENILKEEEMQREAEALLASLGIDLGDITVTSDNMDDVNETFDDGPSRDELKASLKINSVQKDVLNKLKEYR